MPVNNKPRTWRNSQPLFRAHGAHAPGIGFGHGAKSGLDDRHLVWLRQLDTALQRSSRIRHLHLDQH
jgi:hypothetical protein